MQVRCVNELDAFDALQPRWDAVHRTDPQARVFTRWAWLRGWFARHPFRWLVLAARDEHAGEDVAYLPLSVHPLRDRRRPDRAITLRMGGSPAADYTGFICLPEHVNAALAALAVFIQSRLAWDVFEMRDVRDERLDNWLARFDASRFTVERLPDTPCPCIDLPATWDEYLRQRLGKRTREGMRKQMRRIERLPGFRATDAEPATLDRHLDVLFTFWQARWTHARQENVARFRSIYEHCFADGLLWLRALWDGDEPLAALAALIDENQRSFCYYMSGFNQDRPELSAGMVVRGHAIRHAIESGMTTCDLLRGDEPYKYRLGAVDRLNTNLRISRRSVISHVRRRIDAARRTIIQRMHGG